MTETNPDGIPCGKFRHEFEFEGKIKLWGSNWTGQEGTDINVQIIPETGGCQSATISERDYKKFRSLLERHEQRMEENDQ